MKVEKLNSLGAAAPKRKAKKSEAADGEFAKALAGDGGEASAVAGAPTLGPIDALLSIQEVPDSLARRARAQRRGEELLDRLDELRLGLLMGRLPVERIEALARLAASQKDQVSEPALAQVLEEIELRAAVELAKLGR